MSDMGVRGNPRQVIENERPRKAVGVSHHDRSEDEDGISPRTFHRQPTINSFAKPAQLDFCATCIPPTRLNEKVKLTLASFSRRSFLQRICASRVNCVYEHREPS